MRSYVDKSAALRQFRFFAMAPESIQAQMESVATPVHLAPGRYFVREGQMCPQFAVVIAGRLRVFKVGENGREITIYHVCAGDTCLANMLCVLLGISSPANAVVEEALDALVMPAASFRRWVAEVDSVRQFVFQAMASRYMTTLALVEEITFGKLDQRLADYLQRHFVDGDRDLPEVVATHEAIATDLGSAREVISRLLKQFERRGVIETGRGRIKLRNAGVLESLGRKPVQY